MNYETLSLIVFILGLLCVGLGTVGIMIKYLRYGIPSLILGLALVYLGLGDDFLGLFKLI